MIFDTIENLSRYIAYDKRLKHIETFVAENDLHALSNGTYELSEDITANVSDYVPGKGGQFEAHRKYIDLQLIVSGNEIIEVLPLSEVKDGTGYAPDIEFFNSQLSKSNALIMNPGSFAVFEPRDAHRPCIKHTAETIRKIVFKIPVA